MKQNFSLVLCEKWGAPDEHILYNNTTCVHVYVCAGSELERHQFTLHRRLSSLLLSAMCSLLYMLSNTRYFQIVGIFFFDDGPMSAHIYRIYTPRIQHTHNLYSTYTLRTAQMWYWYHIRHPVDDVRRRNTQEKPFFGILALPPCSWRLDRLSAPFLLCLMLRWQSERATIFARIANAVRSVSILFCSVHFIFGIIFFVCSRAVCIRARYHLSFSLSFTFKLSGSFRCNFIHAHSLLWRKLNVEWWRWYRLAIGRYKRYDTMRFDVLWHGQPAPLVWEDIFRVVVGHQQPGTPFLCYTRLLRRLWRIKGWWKALKRIWVRFFSIDWRVSRGAGI